MILNWLTFSDSKDVGKEEERDSEAVSFASSATLSLCDLGTPLQKNLSLPFLSKRRVLILTSCSAVLL